MSEGKEQETSSLSVLEMEGKLREKIRELQEKRAASLMAEISELQKERDIAVSQVKKMDSIVADIRKENAVMKQNERNFVNRIQGIERSLLEEKLVNEDWKKKFQKLEKKNKELTSKLGSSSYSPYQRLQAKDRSHSLTDLNQLNDRENESRGQSTLNTLQVHQDLSPSPSPSPSQSPSVIHRRYRLATIQTSSNETQTDEISAVTEFHTTENLPRPVLEILASAREDILKLQQQKKDIQKQLHKLALEKKSEEEKQVALISSLQALNEEKEVLKESLSQFSKWVHNKISAIEEDMDICRVVYSLHGSLSKEANRVEELQHRLSLRESALQETKTVNKHIGKALNEAEERMKELELENRELREQLHHQYGSLAKLSELRLQSSYGRNLSLPSPLIKHKHA